MTMPDTIVCMYSCHACGLKDVRVPVRIRYTGEDVKAWLDDAVIPAMSADHRAKRGTTCTPKALQELKIPMDGRTQVGGPVIQ